MFQHYSVQKRKRIALVSTSIIALVLVGVLIMMYTNPRTLRDSDLSSIMEHGYTTFVEGAQSFFTKK